MVPKSNSFLDSAYLTYQKTLKTSFPFQDISTAPTIHTLFVSFYILAIPILHELGSGNVSIWGQVKPLFFWPATSTSNRHRSIPAHSLLWRYLCIYSFWNSNCHWPTIYRTPHLSYCMACLILTRFTSFGCQHIPNDIQSYTCSHCRIHGCQFDSHQLAC